MSTTSRGVCVVLAVLAGCGDDDVESEPASMQSAATAAAWFDLELRLVRQTPGFTPPVASRAFAYAGVTLYESVVPGMPDYRSLAGVLDGLPAMPEPEAGAVYYWPAAANRGLAQITRQLFATATPENVIAIDALETELQAQYAMTVAPGILERSAAYGDAVAAAVFAWSRGDGGDEGYLDNFPTSYVPPTGAGLWVPTAPGYQPAMQPYWGANRTFCLASADECDVTSPPAYSTEEGSLCYEQAMEVYEASAHLTAAQEQIARFWADEPIQTATPAGHSISILTQVLDQNGATLDVAAEAYARLGIAVGDAFISAWATKYRYNVLRPISYIRDMWQPRWTPLIITPPFPEYPSGHSVQSAAAAQVLTDLFGPLAFTDRTAEWRGLGGRSYGSFFAAAEEAAISRMYAGIHYAAGIEDGLTMGRCVGACVSALPLRR